MDNAITARIRRGACDERLKQLYGDEKRVKSERERYARLTESFCGAFGIGGETSGKIQLLSVPGRSEVGGNHTDHEHGMVLACAVDLDIIAAAMPNGGGTVRIKSEGFPADAVGLDDLEARSSEKNSSAALVRGVCARLKGLGYKIGGFDACMTSNVPAGSGLSSSAAFEVMITYIISCLFNDEGIDPVTMAKAGQYAEREYFGKPCGLMDQTACASGGFITIDFLDPERPAIEKIGFDFAKTGFTLCIVNTAGSHSSLTADYAAIGSEMGAVAAFLGGRVLRDCDETSFYRHLPQLRSAAGDRAVLRAMHFFGENARVSRQAEALRQGDFERFRSLVIESGRSSWMFLQNVYTSDCPERQELAVALALAGRMLSGCGAWRVHGGGFSGTIQAFVPDGMIAEFTREMDGVFGGGAVLPLKIRQAGAFAVK